MQVMKDKLKLKTKKEHQESKNIFHIQIESTEMHLMHHSILLHAKALFPIDNGTFLKVNSF